MSVQDVVRAVGEEEQVLDSHRLIFDRRRCHLEIGHGYEIPVGNRGASVVRNVIGRVPVEVSVRIVAKNVGRQLRAAEPACRRFGVAGARARHDLLRALVRIDGENVIAVGRGAVLHTDDAARAIHDRVVEPVARLGPGLDAPTARQRAILELEHYRRDAQRAVEKGVAVESRRVAARAGLPDRHFDLRIEKLERCIERLARADAGRRGRRSVGKLADHVHEFPARIDRRLDVGAVHGEAIDLLLHVNVRDAIRACPAPGFAQRRDLGRGCAVALQPTPHDCARRRLRCGR